MAKAAPTEDPKAFSKLCLKLLKPLKAKISVVKAEKSHPRGWDYNLHLLLEILLPTETESLRASVTLNVAATGSKEVSGNVTLDSNWGGVISTHRASEPDSVVTRMMSDVVNHLKSKDYSESIRPLIRDLSSMLS